MTKPKTIAIAVVGVLVLLGVMIAGLGTLTTTITSDCSGAAGSPTSGTGAAGPQGGLGGTGITASELATVRGSRASGPAYTGGTYNATSYGPPWGGIQGAGNATAGGLAINGGAPHKYFVAADPAKLGLGTWIYVWPNPFQWTGAFLVADTGGAIDGNHIDIYDWRGREQQLGWGSRNVTVSNTPIRPGAADPSDDTGGTVAASTCTITSSGDVGARAAAIALSKLGKDERGEPFPEFTPPQFFDSWCAWFVTNVWRLAGVVDQHGKPIPWNAWSGFPWQWASQNAPDLVIKAPGKFSTTLTPPVGTAISYGNDYSTSFHVNMVQEVFDDGSFLIIGGNQGQSHVTNWGPCRLINGTYAHLTGPGCPSDYPIWSMVAPATG